MVLRIGLGFSCRNVCTVDPRFRPLPASGPQVNFECLNSLSGAASFTKEKIPFRFFSSALRSVVQPTMASADFSGFFVTTLRWRHSESQQLWHRGTGRAELPLGLPEAAQQRRPTTLRLV